MGLSHREAEADIIGKPASVRLPQFGREARFDGACNLGLPGVIDAGMIHQAGAEGSEPTCHPGG